MLFTVYLVKFGICKYSKTITYESTLVVMGEFYVLQSQWSFKDEQEKSVKGELVSFRKKTKDSDIHSNGQDLKLYLLSYTTSNQIQVEKESKLYRHSQ